MNKYSNAVGATIKKLFAIDEQVDLSRPSSELGDYSTNIALRLAGRLGESPRNIANKIKDEVLLSDLFDDVLVAGPGFINFRVSAKHLMAELISQNKNSRPFGENNSGNNKKCLVEYPSTNMAKPFSVGHLRSANQGWAVRNLMLATGWQVITDNHLGDYGAPFGIWVVGFKKFSNEDALKKRGIYELGDIYIKTKQAIKDELAVGKTNLSDEAQNWLLKLESGDKEAIEYSERFNKISLDHIHKVMARLGISTDYELGEKFFAEKGKKAVLGLLKRGIAKRNEDGSVIVGLDEFNIKVPILLLKSNGAALYATTDLATLIYRQQEFKVDRVIYCVASEQKFYFEQLFALAKKIGINTELIHMWYGLIDQINEDGVREKMSSRKGVVLLEELLDRAEDIARKNTKADTITEEDVKKIAVGAIKFSDFSADRRTGMLFDWKRMFNLTGFSGPYVQYAAVRVNKLLNDNKCNSFNLIEDYDYNSEKSLILKLLDYPSIIKEAADRLEPHRVALFVYELAKELNRYYEHTPIATSKVSLTEKSARLGLLYITSNVFSHALKILGIDIPSKM